MGVDDLQLAQALRRGDPAAEELFFRRYQPRLLKAAVYFLGPYDPDAEDVVQQALLIAFQKMDSYDPERAGLYTWMARICVNLCYQRLDKRRREQAAAQEDLLRAADALVHARDSAAEDRAHQAGLLALLREGISRLGEACSRILTLRDQEGLSYADLGRKLKVPIGTVMSRLARCRRQLKDWVQAQPKEARDA